MNALAWTGEQGFIIKDSVKYSLAIKPDVLGKSFYGLYYEPSIGNKFKTLSNNSINTLSDAEVAELETYITNFIPPHQGHYVDSNGVYLGYGSFVNETEVPSAPPTGGNYIWKNSQWTYVMGVDKDGKYIGNQPFDKCHALVDSAPAGPSYVWNFQTSSWEDTRSLEEYVSYAIKEIEDKAGKVRERYITATPGQAMIYMMKLQEAKAYVANKAAGNTPNMNDYPFINGEATARNDVADNAASLIISTANDWITKGSAIEEKRIYGKVKVASATDVSTAADLLKTIIADLDAL